MYDITYELPHINVERHTGHLFNDEQVEKKDKRITYELVDGGRKFYSPIWSYMVLYGEVWHETEITAYGGESRYGGCATGIRAIRSYVCSYGFGNEGI